MAVVPFSEYAQGEGLSFGLSGERIERIARLSAQGVDCEDLLADPDLAAAGLQPPHLLRLRRAVVRHRRFDAYAARLRTSEPMRNWLQAQCQAWAETLAPDDPIRAASLGLSLAGLVSDCLKRGRLRTHLRDAHDPRAANLGDLAEHTEGADDLPPHRWFAIRRGLADGLVWVEVLPPEAESEAGSEVLGRAVDKPVLDAIDRRSERAVLAAAADALGDLLGRPPIPQPVAGVLADGKRLWAGLLPPGDAAAERADFAPGQVDRLVAWLAERKPALVGLARRGPRAEVSLLRALTGAGLAAEPAREAGLMTQARDLAGPIGAAAAEVIARRLRDPLQSTADLEPEALGLGEYLDMVDAGALRAALADARGAATWARKQGRPAAAAVRGLALNPMVKRVEDLRPGMELSGTVANLTHFGAFVELGLEFQGLIHLSELSERFVKHPSEVVRIGQQVRARVLELDLARQRLSLSLRPDRPARRGSRQTRGQALGALDDLFKK